MFTTTKSYVLVSFKYSRTAGFFRGHMCRHLPYFLKHWVFVFLYRVLGEPKLSVTNLIIICHWEVGIWPLEGCTSPPMCSWHSLRSEEDDLICDLDLGSGPDPQNRIFGSVQKVLLGGSLGSQNFDDYLYYIAVLAPRNWEPERAEKRVCPKNSVK